MEKSQKEMKIRYNDGVVEIKKKKIQVRSICEKRIIGYNYCYWA